MDAQKEKTGGAMTSTDLDLDLEPRRDQDTDGTDWDNDKPPRSLLQDALFALGDQFKLTSCSLGPRTGGAYSHHKVTMAAERTMVEEFLPTCNMIRVSKCAWSQP